MKFFRLVRLSFFFLCLGADGVRAQEIRRALPVEPPTAAPTQAPSQPQPPAPPPNVPGVSAGVNDTAYFLAGLRVSDGSPLAALTRDPAWQQHAAFFDQAWAKLAARQFVGIRDWEENYLPDATQPMPVVYYLFSGPDFLYANQFFPNAGTYILAGTEPIGPLPDVLRFAGPSLDPVLRNLQTSLNSVLRFSFFITKDMKTDLQRQELNGTLPVFYVFLARAGKTITDITFVTLDQSGQPHTTTPNDKSKGSTPGVRVTFTSATGGPSQTLFYFTTDLSNEGIRGQPGFLKFCAAHGVGGSLLKSASYLMFENGFSTVREFLLNHSKAIVQDDSGIPIAAFDAGKWLLRFFGSYAGPIDLFKQYYQPELQGLYQQSNPAPLQFGIGYRWSPRQSTLVVATLRGAELSPMRTEEPPTPTPPVPAPTAPARLPRM
ncbi:MAG: hypothetical protein ABI016_13330 [Chthoniobacterales bacterium]